MQTTGVIVTIHGYGFDSRIWDPVEIAFDGWRVIRLSLPGFGMKMNGDYSVPGLASDYLQSLEGETEIHLLGHSMGGYVCLEMASQMQDRIKSLALVHSHVFEDNAEKKEDRSKVLEDIQQQGHAPFVKKMISSLWAEPSSFTELNDVLIRRGVSYGQEAWYHGTAAIRSRKDQASTWSALSVPTLNIMGEEDKAVPVELGYKQAAMAQQCTFHVYPECGHLSMYEKTGRLITDLLRFYASV